MLDEQSKRHKIWLGAMVASSSSAMVTYPFDSLKTRQQTYNYKSLLHCIRATYKVEGARGFWRGELGNLAARPAPFKPWFITSWHLANVYTRCRRAPD